MSKHAPSSPMSLQEQLVLESCSMVRYLASQGSRVPPQTLQAIAGYDTLNAAGQPVDLSRLASAHDQLSRLVAPARPGTLYLLDRTYSLKMRVSPISLVRHMVMISAVCVAAFVLISIFNLVSAKTTATANSALADASLQNVYLLAAAGVGASFAMLFQINDYITRRTFDPDYAPTYWLKLFLGVVAGFILVAMLPEKLLGDNPNLLAKPTLALLGGFSAQAVYRILSRLVETLEDLVSGGGREQAANREQAATTRATQESAQAKLSVAGDLVELQHQLATGAANGDVARRLGEIVQRLVPPRDFDGADRDASRRAAGEAAAAGAANAGAAAGNAGGAAVDASAGNAGSAASGSAANASGSAGNAPGSAANAGGSAAGSAPPAALPPDAIVAVPARTPAAVVVVDTDDAWPELVDEPVDEDGAKG